MGDGELNDDFIQLPPQEERKRGRGRPPKKEALGQELRRRAREREEFVTNHKLVQANPAPAESNSSVNRLILVKHQMAREAAALEFNKFHMDLEGKDTSTVSSRIVGTLSKMSDIDLEIKKLGATVVDPHSSEVQNMVQIWVETLTGALSDMVRDKTLDAQSMDLLINKFSNALEGWEDQVGGSD